MNHVTFFDEGEVSAYKAQFAVLRELFRSAENVEISLEAQNALVSFPMNQFVKPDFPNNEAYFDSEKCAEFVKRMYIEHEDPIVEPERPQWVKFSINDNGEIEFIF